MDGLLLPRQTKEGAHGRRGRSDQLQACHGSVAERLRGGAVAPVGLSNSSLGLCSQVHWIRGGVGGSTGAAPAQKPASGTNSRIETEPSNTVTELSP